MLGLFKKAPKTDEQIKKELEQKREAVLRKADALRPLVLAKEESWLVYRSLIEDYVNACKKRKAITALDRLIPGNPEHEKTLHELKLLDHEIFILNWVLEFPFSKIQEADKIIQQGNKPKETNDGTD